MANTENPKGSDQGEFKQTRQRRIEEYDRLGYLGRKAQNSFYKLLMYATILSIPQYRNNPQFRELLRFENRVGLLKDSIISTKLWTPSEDGDTLIFSEASTAGEWLGYDFRRPQELSARRQRRERPVRQHFNGTLFVIDFDEQNEYGSDHYTPTGAHDLSRLDSVLHMDVPTLEETLEKGYIRETTHEESYRSVGLSGRYAEDIGEIGDHKVYCVTPKGNGVVFLDPSGGEKHTLPEATKTRSRLIDIFPQPSPVRI